LILVVIVGERGEEGRKQRGWRGEHGKESREYEPSRVKSEERLGMIGHRKE
jgi:hypothetical protein